MASAYVARSYGSAYTLGFKIKNNNQKQYISSFGVSGLLTDLKKHLAIYRTVYMVMQTHMHSRLIVLCLESNGKGYAKSNTPAVPIWKEVEIAIKAEGAIL